MIVYTTTFATQVKQYFRVVVNVLVDNPALFLQLHGRHLTVVLGGIVGRVHTSRAHTHTETPISSRILLTLVWRM